MKRGKIHLTLGCFVAVVVLASVANAQSKQIGNPTPLTSNEISGVIDEKTKDGAYYYYSFWANPGEVKVTITVERNLNIDNDFTITSAEFVLYDSNSEVIARKAASTYSGSSAPTGVTTAQVQIAKRQILVLGLRLPGGLYFGGVGKYKVRIDGADVKPRPNGSEPRNLDDVFAGALSSVTFSYPEKGKLVMMFAKGSMQIKLDSVESIQIYDPRNHFKTKELSYGEVNLPKEGNISIRMKDDSAILKVDFSQISNIAIL